MASIEWSQAFSVGIDIIDNQHKQLFHAFDVLEGAIARGTGGDQLSPLFNRMVGYVWNHLRFEEKLLKKHGYPALHEHMARHHSLEERLQEFFDLYDHEVTQRDQIARDVAQFLRDWLLGHIQDEDHKYAIFFYGKPIGNQRGRGPGG